MELGTASFRFVVLFLDIFLNCPQMSSYRNNLYAATRAHCKESNHDFVTAAHVVIIRDIISNRKTTGQNRETTS